MILKNKELKQLLFVAIGTTIAASLCGYALCGIAAVLLLLALSAILTITYFLLTRRRYQDIAALNAYLEKVLAGGEAPSILDQEEGELSLLKTNLYKTTSTLTHQKELLSKDKISLSTAIADISHQLKTPLTSMIVMNDLLLTEQDPAKRREFLEVQSGQLDRMNWLIQTLLKLSKIDAGTITMNPKPVVADRLIAEVLKPFEIQMELKNITCQCQIPQMIIRCDPNWTVEALQNIVKNCIEHLSDGGWLSITADETNIYSEVVIEDHGCGIVKEDLSHIFERFYKGKSAKKDSVGIGLALAQTILISQHGEILVESEPGAYTKFSVRFYKTII